VSIMQPAPFLGKSRDGESRRTPALIFTVIFFVAILVLSLAQNSQIVLVLLLYFCILVEGISVSALVLYSRDSPPSELYSRNSTETEKVPRGTDVVSSMDIYVTYAVRGSSHSRREIAFIIKNLLNDRQLRRESRENNDPRFQSDLNAILRYLDESAPKEGKKESRKEREAYLASLERVVAKLRADSFHT